MAVKIFIYCFILSKRFIANIGKVLIANLLAYQICPMKSPFYFLHHIYTTPRHSLTPDAKHTTSRVSNATGLLSAAKLTERLTNQPLQCKRGSSNDVFVRCVLSTWRPIKKGDKFKHGREMIVTSPLLTGTKPTGVLLLYQNGACGPLYSIHLKVYTITEKKHLLSFFGSFFFLLFFW